MVIRRSLQRILALILSISLLPPIGLVHAQATVAGFTPGSFKVNETGAATYTIPIQAPPGVAGMEPKLSLNYNSQGGSGLLGVGWFLGGLSAITRCPRTVSQDGVRGGVLYDSNDRYCLDGQRLIAVSGTYGADGTEYRTERDSFTRIISYSTAGNGPAYFKVWTKSGQIMEFGNDTPYYYSRIEAQDKNTVRVYALNKISDTKGNYLTVTYTEDSTNGDYRPARIDYTGNTAASLTPNLSVQFFYQTRTDVTPLYVAGSVIKTMQRLTDIKTYIGTTLIRDYQLAYQTSPDTSRSRMTSITECDGSGACLPATSLSWSAPSMNFGTDTSWGTRSANFKSEGGGLQLYDMNGDGLNDVIYDSDAGVRVMLGTGTSFGTDTNWGNRSQGFTTSSPGLRFADVNRDGMMDVVYDGGSGVMLKLSTGTGFSAETTWGTRTDNLNTNDASRIQVVDVNGDNYPDLVYTGATGVRVLINNGTSLGTDTNWGTRTQSFNSNGGGSKVVDVNGDGFPDFVYDSTNGMRVLLNNGGTGFGTDTFWGDRTDSYTTSAPGFHLVDMNGDGLPDVVYDAGDGVHVMLNTGTAFSTDTMWGDRTASFGSNAKGLRFADLNADGKTDVIYDATDGMRVLLSTGTAFTTDAIWGDRTQNINTNNPSRLLTQDVGIDGRGDIVYDGSGVRVLPTSGIISDLMISVVNGLGATTAVSYKPLPDSTVYTKDTTATYPTRDLRVPLFVVSSYTTSDGIGGNYQMSYFYTGAKADLNGRGFLGFSTVQATDPLGIKSLTTFCQDWPYLGLPSQVKKTTSGGSMLNQVDNTFACKDFDADPDTCTVAAGKRYFPYVSQSVEASNDLNGTAMPSVTIANTFDSYGNATQIVVSTSVGGTADGYSKTTANTYTNDTTNWLLGRLTRSTVTSVTP